MKIVFVILLILLFVFVLYLLAVMPRMTYRKDMNGFCRKHYAHRGLHNNKGDAPENSLKAFRLAVEAQYGIELDVQLTKDKIPVIFHDYTLERVCGVPKKVNELDYAELRKLNLCKSEEIIPTFDEVLEVVDGKVPLIIEHKIEFKDLSLCPIVMERLSHYRGMYCIESFNPLCLMWYRKHYGKVIRGQLSTNLVKEHATKSTVLSFFLQNLLLNFLTKPDFIAFEHRYGNMTSFRINRSLYHVPTFAWTIKSEDDLQKSSKQFQHYIFEGFLPVDEKEL